jgi:hypothetical protein
MTGEPAGPAAASPGEASPEQQALDVLAGGSERVEALAAELSALLDLLPAVRPREEAAVGRLDRPLSLCGTAVVSVQRKLIANRYRGSSRTTR